VCVLGHAVEPLHCVYDKVHFNFCCGHVIFRF
jgi:hypothetical protein